MVQDSCHAQLHLEVQKVIPRVFEEQILYIEKEDKRNTKKSDSQVKPEKPKDAPPQVQNQ